MKFMVVDGSPVAYQQFSSVGHLSTKSGIPTGLRFGFMRAIRSYEKKLAIDKVVICWDTKGPIIKAEGRGEYKANRVPTAEKQKLYDQLPDLQAMISLTHWSQAWADGYEADDVVGALARKLESQGHEVIVVTTDNDMTQLMTEKVQIYVPGKNARIKTREEVVQQFGVGPEVLLYWRAARGDASDNLAGIKVGNFQELLKKALTGCFGPLVGYRHGPREMEAVVQWVRKSAGDAVAEEYSKNLKVMSLVSPEKLSIQKGQRSREELLQLFEALEFKSLVGRIEEFMGGPTVESCY